MLLELSVSQKGKRLDANDMEVDPAAIAGATGLRCEKSEKGTVLEGDWEPLMAAAKKWHDQAMKKGGSTTTVIRAVDSPELAAHLHRPGEPCCGQARDLPEDDGDWLML